MNHDRQTSLLQRVLALFSLRNLKILGLASVFLVVRYGWGWLMENVSWFPYVFFGVAFACIAIFFAEMFVPKEKD